MTEENHDTIRRRTRIYYVRRVFFLLFHKKVLRLIPWLVGFFVIFWAAGIFFIRPIAKANISRLCNGAVYVESGRFKGVSGIRLKGVVIAENTDDLVNDPIFKSDEIDIRFNPWTLLRGKLRVSSISLINSLLVADYYVESDRWNFQDLYSKEASGSSGRIPFVMVRSGTVQVRHRDPNAIQSITTVGINGQIAVNAAECEYSFTLESDGRFGFGGSRVQGLLKMGAAPKKSQLSVQGRLQMPQAVIFENSWNLEDIRLECEFDRKEVVLKHCGFSMGSGQADIRGAVREIADDHRELNLDVNISDFFLSDGYKKDAIVYSRPILERLDAGLRRFLVRYHPKGSGDVNLSIQGRLDDLSTVQVDGTILSRDISVLDEKFPYQLEHIEGTIDLSGRNLAFNELKARHADVVLRIDGSIQNLGPESRIDVHTTSSNMEFNEDLWKALNPSLKEVWRSFTPRGRTAVDYHFQRFADGRRDLTLTLALQKAGLVYEHFPYPLENMTGRVVMMPDSVEFQEVVSHYDDDRVITLNGQVLKVKSSQPNFNIHVQAEHIPVNELLINAMPVSQRDFFNRLQLEAVADMDVNVFPNAVGTRFLDYIAKIRVDGKRLVYSGFPLPMEDVHLRADVTHEKIILHHFEGMTAGGQVVMSGLLRPRGIQEDRPGMCLELALENFDFNDVFWDAAGPDAERLLGKLRMRGRMDISGHMAMNFPESSCPATDLVIQCSDNPVVWGQNLLGQAFGQLRLKGDTIWFDDFQLRGGRLESVPADLLEGTLKNAYSGIQPEGEVDLRIDKGTLRMGESGIEQIDAKGGVVLKNAAGGHERAIHGLFGDVDAHLQFNRDRQTWQALASFDIDQFNYRDWLISDFHGHFAYDPNTKHFEGTDVVADLYDGKILGDIEVDLSNEDTIGYRLGFSANEIDVPQLLAAGEQGSFNRVSQGQAFGALTLEGDLKSPSRSRGKMTARVVNMKLGKQSVLGKILTAMQFQQPEEYVFSEFQAEAFIRESQLIIEDIRMVGKPLVFRGKGKLDLIQKQIEMDWVAFDRLMGKEDTILDLLARGIGSAIWKVEVRGDMNDPQIKAVFLSVLKQPLDIFKKEE